MSRILINAKIVGTLIYGGKTVNKKLIGIISIVVVVLIAMNFLMIQMNKNVEGSDTDKKQITIKIDSDGSDNEASNENDTDNENAEGDNSESNTTAEDEVIPLGPTSNFESGLYGYPLTIELKSESMGTIYYTLDESEPTEESLKYTGPIELDNRTFLNAVVVSDTGLVSEVITFEYYIEIISNSELSGIDFTVTASSTLKEVVDGNVRVYGVSNLFDDNNRTVWSEATDGDGRGEVITFTASEAFDFETFSITNGFIYSINLYNNNNRCTAVIIETDTGDKRELRMEDGRLSLVEYEIDFEEVTSFTLTFTDIIPGNTYNDLCISEMRINDQLINIISE